MQTNRSSCPVNREVGFLGDRWGPVLSRKTVFAGHRRFRDFRAAPRESGTPSRLSTRLSTWQSTHVTALQRVGLEREADVARGNRGSCPLGVVPCALAQIGSIWLSPAEPTEGRFNDGNIDRDKIGACTDELRVSERLTAPISHDESPFPAATRSGIQ